MLQTAIQNIRLEEGALLLIDKPLRWTSFDVINKIKYEIRKHTSIKKFKIGHAGTLDPLATGLLIICIGKYTKQIPGFQDLYKRYTGTFVIGATTKSYDLEYDPEDFQPYESVNLKTVQKVVTSLTGTIEQTPPVFSAVKIQGRPAFEYARQAQEIEIASKTVHIYNFNILRFEPPEIDFEINCSKGTYIRSIARDLGEKLGCGAYLSVLRRTEIGNFHLKEAYSMEPFLSESKTGNPHRKKKRFDL